MANLGKLISGLGNTVGKAAKSGSTAARAVAKSTPGKVALAGAAVGGGSYVAMSGIGNGMEKVADGVNYTLDTTGATALIGTVVPDFKPKSSKTGTVVGNDQESSSGSAATGIGSILMVVGIVILAVIIVKNLKKSRRA